MTKRGAKPKPARALAKPAPATQALLPYEQACRAVAAALSVDEAKQLHDKADAIRVYAKKAKNRQLEIDAAEIRMRAERRLGQLIGDGKKAGKISRGQPPKPKKKSAGTEEYFSRVQLRDLGIDHKLSARAQKMAAVVEKDFVGLLRAWRDNVLGEAAKVTTSLLKIGEEDRQRQARRDLASDLSTQSVKLAAGKKYPCIYADPPWRRKAGIGDRAYENHFPTMTWQQIIELPVKDLLLPDSWGFIWIPRAHLLALHPVSHTVEIDDGSKHDVKIPTPLIWAVADAWGFDAYSTTFVWTKTDEKFPEDCGTGLIVLDQDELLVMFKRGRGLPKPASVEKFGSNHRERSRPLGHSRKPEHYRTMISRMVGTDRAGAPLPVLELFARVDAGNPLPRGWDAWGNQAQFAEAAE